MVLDAYDSKALKEIGQGAEELRTGIQAKFSLGRMGIPTQGVKEVIPSYWGI